MPKRGFTAVVFTMYDREAELLDKLCKEYGVRRSALFRLMLNHTAKEKTVFKTEPDKENIKTDEYAD
jgi:hypothetical protein